MRNFGRIIYLALAPVLHDPLPRHRAVFQRALTSDWSLVCWSPLVQYRTHTTKTLNSLADYLEEFYSSKDVFTTYQTLKATGSIAHARMKDPKMQLVAKHAFEDEDQAQCREALSRVQNEHQKTQNKMRLPEVYNSTVHEHTSFDFIKIHLMLHYKESVQHFRHLVKDSTRTQEMNHLKMYMGPYCWSNRNFWYSGQFFNNYSRIHVFQMWFLHLWQLASEAH